MNDWFPVAEGRPVSTRDAFQGLHDELSERVIPKSDSLTLQQMSEVRPGKRCALHHSHHRLSADKPSLTVDRGGGAGEWHIWHYSENRPITRKEVRRLGSFPDNFTFFGGISDAFVRIGNSVPPLLMRSVACHIRQSILTNAPPVRGEA